MRVLQKEISSEKSKMTVIAEEALSNVRTVKAFASEDSEIVKFLDGNLGVEKIALKKTGY